MPFLTTTGVLPVTCEVGLSRSVRAFHIMPGLPGPEGQLHDHDYRIEIVVDREQLDDRGMVCDLDVLEAALTELTSRVEGRNLEEIRPAGGEAVTVEAFARWVHDSLSPAGCMTASRPLSLPQAARHWQCGCGKLPSRSADTAHGADTLPNSPGDLAILMGGYRYQHRCDRPGQVVRHGYCDEAKGGRLNRSATRLNSSHLVI